MTLYPKKDDEFPTYEEIVEIIKRIQFRQYK
jgi:hypothetical protein